MGANDPLAASRWAGWHYATSSDVLASPEDLAQDAALALVSAGKWESPDFLSRRVKFAAIAKVRSLTSYGKRQPALSLTRWDGSVEDPPAPEERGPMRDDLALAVEKSRFSQRESRMLLVWLECGSWSEAGREVGLSTQRAIQLGRAILGQIRFQWNRLQAIDYQRRLKHEAS